MFLWIGFILIFFALQALLWVVAISMARQHPVRPALSSPEPQAAMTSERKEQTTASDLSIQAPAGGSN